VWRRERDEVLDAGKVLVPGPRCELQVGTSHDPALRVGDEVDRTARVTAGYLREKRSQAFARGAKVVERI
jgi:hypothetical protein